MAMQAPPPLPPVGDYQPARQTNVWAVISLMSSLLAWLGLFGIGGVIGIVTGIIARNDIANSNGTQTGEELAIIGIILGALNVLLTCVGILCIAALTALPLLSLL
ncbi:MAG: DUF4190 domain-containing protein [Anaerolineae bacterium]|nr:DUF4190 domain-containing protein [Thermoflexales bacterium]MDW8395347.1 DUF4190 domain-containing protein [Anaerolineae bacterium]